MKNSFPILHKKICLSNDKKFAFTYEIDVLTDFSIKGYEASPITSTCKHLPLNPTSVWIHFGIQASSRNIIISAEKRHLFLYQTHQSDEYFVAIGANGNEIGCA